ncbi:MAG TPA: multiheme c-type cytochrome ExtKL [Thermodesulfovibrionales bacterium]|nr:multiheme c-type cytochrome ExtKL [Thermodesulfovibrionales bacterium]
MQLCMVLVIAAMVALPFAASAEYKTIDEVVKAYSDESCKTCHAKVYDEWKASYHAQSVVHSVGGIRNFIVVGLGKEWDKPVSKEHLMRCMDCHAPHLKDASESLIKEVAQLIVASVDEKDEGKKAAAKRELGKLNVNCVICHNTKVSIEKNLKGAPKEGVYYGPSGNPSPAHGTEKSSVITSAIFCGQCHGMYTPPDGDVIGCNTLYGSYQDAYRGNGGTETCQECHMEKANRGHTFPGAYQVEIVREGIGLDVQAAGIRLHPGKWVPTAIVNVGLINKAGHRIPDG